MTRREQIAIIAAFLVLIYTVPAVQTVYEYRHNEKHRIQMLDLPTDLLVTPLTKARQEAATIGQLRLTVDSLAGEVAQNVKGDSAKPWDSQKAEGLIDESVIKTKSLIQGVLEYNRHVQGERNVYVHGDTVKPYFRALRRARERLRGVQKMITQGEDPAVIKIGVDSLKADVTVLESENGGAAGSVSYPRLVLTALRRIMVGANYLRPYEKEMEKVSVFAVTIRPCLQFTYYLVYGDLGDKGVQGRQDWFFYRPDVDFLTKPYVFDHRSQIVDANDVAIKDSIVDTIVAFKKHLADRGIDMLLVIMPGKPSIYPDLLSDKMKPEQAGRITHSLRMLDQLKKAGVETVNLFEPFAQERLHDAEYGDSIYLHTDTHFKTRAVRLCAKVIADRVKQYPWYAQGTTEYAVDSVFVDRSGDVAEMTKLASLRIKDLRLFFDVEKTKCYQVFRIERDSSGAEAVRIGYEDERNRAFNLRNSKILLLGDSFSRIYQTDPPTSAGWISHLAAELSQPITAIVNDGGASTNVRETLARKTKLLKNKKLVIWEIVERDFRFGEKGWKDISLAANAEDAEQ